VNNGEELNISQRRYLTVAQNLLTAISNGDYAAGDRLPAHTEIAAQAGVSRATAREAFLALELIGVIEVRHGDGTFVRRRAQVVGTAGSALDAPPRELIETRLRLEPITAGLAAQRITADQLERLDESINQQTALINRPDKVADFVAFGLKFHADLAPACGNSLLADIVAQLVNVEQHPLWALVNQRGLPDTYSRQRQVDEHRAVLDAVRAHQAEAATHAMSLHLSELEESMFGSITDPLLGRPARAAE
jgi:GntR family uxuAB operon transcriptional repressor